jgi:hypothetical protein
MTKIITCPTVHTFDSTVDAYDAVNSDDSIRDGDVLIVADERVVGIAVSAWPTAVTPEHGAFHTLAEGVEWSCVGKRDEDRTDYTIAEGPHAGQHTYVIPADPGTDYTASVEVARLHARAVVIADEGGCIYADAVARAQWESDHNLLP